MSSALVLLMPVFVGRLRLPDSALGLLGCSSVAFMQIALGQIVSPSMAWVALLGESCEVLRTCYM